MPIRDEGLVIVKENTPVGLRCHASVLTSQLGSLFLRPQVCGLPGQNSREKHEAPAIEQGLLGPSKCYHGAAALIKRALTSAAGYRASCALRAFQTHTSAEVMHGVGAAETPPAS